MAYQGTGMSERAIIKKINAEYATSLDLVQTRRIQFRDRLGLYNNQRKQQDKVGIPTLYTIINTLLAVYYTDKLTVNFIPRTIGDRMMADNLNMLAEFDYDEMSMEVMNYYNQWDRLFFGVGIRILTGWDKDTKTPIFKNIDPLSWYPDPEGSMYNDFRWHGFEVEMSAERLTKDEGYYGVKDIQKGNKSTERELDQDSYRDASGLTDSGDTSEQLVSVYHHYTYLEGKPYLISLAGARSKIIRMIPIDPVGVEEQKDPCKIKLPVVLNYYSPQRNNPYGVSVGDLVEDKQRAMSILANLRIKKEKAELYPMYLYNTQKIRNRRDLDFGFNKLIAVNGAVDAGTIQPIQKDFNKAMTFNVEQSIDQEAQVSTGASTVQQGVTSEDQRTLGEIQTVQANANLRFLLGSRINSWGDKFFWKLWFREYKANFKTADKKIIRISNGYGIKPMVIQRKDFITVEDPDVEVSSRIETLNKKEKERIAFMQAYPLLANDPDLPQISRNYAKREMLRVSGLEQEKINVLVPHTPEEYKAYQENELIKRNQLPTALPQEDHLTHIFIHQQEEDTNANQVHQETHWGMYGAGQRQEAMMQEEEMLQQQAGAMRQQSNIAQAQIGNQSAAMNQQEAQQVLNS